MRKLGVAFGCSVWMVASHSTMAGADASSLRATMTCDRADAPGRVRCEVEARVGPGDSITWGDVVIQKTPPFAAALRGRIGPTDATAHDPLVWRWALALVARERGAGDVEGRVRVVTCHDGKCAPDQVDVKARLLVGD